MSSGCGEFSVRVGSFDQARRRLRRCARYLCGDGLAAPQMLEDLRDDERIFDAGNDIHRTHFAKYRSMLPSLALITHLADGGTGPVSAAAARRAVGWAGYWLA